MKSKTSLTVSLGWGKFSPLRSSQGCQPSLTKHDVFLHPPTPLPVYHSWNGFLFSGERRRHDCIDFSVDSYLPKKSHQESRGSDRAKSQLTLSSSMSQALLWDPFCFAFINSPLLCHWRSYEPHSMNVWPIADQYYLTSLSMCRREGQVSGWVCRALSEILYWKMEEENLPFNWGWWVGKDVGLQLFGDCLFKSRIKGWIESLLNFVFNSFRDLNSGDAFWDMHYMVTQSLCQCHRVCL